MKNAHSFHIPVMGIGFTIDTPLKVAQYGIDSTISLVDDQLLEKLRKMYCEKYEVHYTEITKETKDYRANRITAYLNLIKTLIEKKFNALISKEDDAKDYFNLLPDDSTIKKDFENFLTMQPGNSEIENWMENNLSIGSIDVNIMTKVDKVNYYKNEKLPTEFNDAHAAIRGYANSDLTSSLILSAGMNPRLYGYIENFEDFFPTEEGTIKKKIVLKVSDYRSALIQGKFLAKKGIWISEYRVESGLNCGGHAFASDGFLLGPILAEFRDKRTELQQTLNLILKEALLNKQRKIPTNILPIKVTAQGGVGTAEEHQFLMDEYKLDSIGWGTPFLLVPEVANVDKLTLEKLIIAKEADLYLSNISPLGVPFNSLRGNTKDMEKLSLVMKGNPGSSCPKKYVALNNEFTEKPICTASRQYQYLKLKKLDSTLSTKEYQSEYAKIVDKSCICVGLGTSALLVNNLDTIIEGPGVSVCPGPNMAYFSKKLTMKEMIDHIYGKINVISINDRPNLFIKELKIYVEFLKDKINSVTTSTTDKQVNYLLTFVNNLKEGINYYTNLFDNLKNTFKESKLSIITDLNTTKDGLNGMIAQIQNVTKEACLV